jgi:general secretion pathway protein F
MDGAFPGIIGTIIVDSYREDSPWLGIIGFIIVIVVLRWAPRIADSVVHMFSGEQRSLMTSGFLRHSTRVRRTIELQGIVSRLAMITRMNLPLCPALGAASQGESRRVKEILCGLATCIHQGASVSSALGSVVRGCPGQLLAALRQGESCGQLAKALDQQEHMIDVMIDRQFQTTAHIRHAIGYALVMMLVCGVMVFGIMVFLIPKFKDIFLDFDVMLPRTTVALLELSDWLAINAMMALVVMGLISLSAVLVVMSRPSSRATKSQRIIAKLRSWFPLTNSLDHGFGMAKAIRTMALSVRSGAPNALAQSCSPVVSETNSLRARLDIFSENVLNGVAPHAAAQEAQLGMYSCALAYGRVGEDPQRTGACG